MQVAPHDHHATARIRTVTDGALLAGALLTFASGLVLFFAFHTGHGCLRAQALGLSRLAWQNLHRLSAVVVLAAGVAHATFNRRPIGVRLSRVLRGDPARHDVHELAVYVCVAVTIFTGFWVWLGVGGSMPIFGPVRLGRVANYRHPWIDTHNLVALLALVLTTTHVRRRWRALGVLLKRAHPARPEASLRSLAPSPEPRSPWPWARPHQTRFIAVDTHQCEACWNCVRACPQKVLGKVEVLWHRHVRIDHANACTGCGKCVRACEHGAITAIAKPVRAVSSAASSDGSARLA